MPKPVRIFILEDLNITDMYNSQEFILGDTFQWGSLPHHTNNRLHSDAKITTLCHVVIFIQSNYYFLKLLPIMSLLPFSAFFLLSVSSEIF